MTERVVARTPVRVADVGGWTDTWFGSPGQVCSLAMGPAVEVEAAMVARPEDGVVHLRAPAVDLDLVIGPDPLAGWDRPLPGRDPLLEHAVGAILGEVAVPDDVGIDLHVASAVPPGASLGTSASVLVAVLGALDALVAGGHRSPEDLARLAHEVETGQAGREAGVQDQWAAALGGALHLTIPTYPEVRATALGLDAATVAALDARVVTVAFGPHDSSAVHHEVIDALLSCSGAAHDGARRALGDLARLARDAADALVAGDVDGWGRVLVAATDAQRALHPGLVGPAHQRAIDVARDLGAVGWKVNGAGGAGGSLTVLAGGPGGAGGGADRLRSGLAAVDPTWQVLDLTVAPGLTVSRA